MNKSLEAALRGYILFRVNSEYFLAYNSARRRRLEMSGSVAFYGLHIFKGWRCFFMDIVINTSMQEKQS